MSRILSNKSKPPFDDGKLYYAQGRTLNAAWRVMLKFFEERRMDGDQMRDSAQAIEALLRDAEDVPSESFAPKTSVARLVEKSRQLLTGVIGRLDLAIGDMPLNDSAMFKDACAARTHAREIEAVFKAALATESERRSCKAPGCLDTTVHATGLCYNHRLEQALEPD